MANPKILQPGQWLSERLLKSPDSGNKLQDRDNGLYYGVEQPAFYQELYVDAIRGNDNNPGTREQPVRTFIKALTMPELPGNRVIFLHTGQDHDIIPDGLRYEIVQGGYVYVIPYGDDLDRILGNNIKGWWYARNDVFELNTRLNFKPNIVTYDSNLPNAIFILNTWMSNQGEMKFIFRGIQIHLHEHRYAQYIKKPFPLVKGLEGYQGKTVEQHSHRGSFSSYHNAQVNITTYGSSIHFHHSPEAIRLGYLQEYTDGETSFNGFQEHLFQHCRGIYGEGGQILKTASTSSLTVNILDNYLMNDTTGRGPYNQYITREMFNKYFKAIGIDKRGFTSCTTNNELKSLINGY